LPRLQLPFYPGKENESDPRANGKLPAVFPAAKSDPVEPPSHPPTSER
jgi:hypothetical protein